MKGYLRKAWVSEGGTRRQDASHRTPFRHQGQGSPSLRRGNMEDAQLWSPWERAGQQCCDEQGSGLPGVFQDFPLMAEKLISNGDRNEHTSACQP